MEELVAMTKFVPLNVTLIGGNCFWEDRGGRMEDLLAGVF